MVALRHPISAAPSPPSPIAGGPAGGRRGHGGDRGPTNAPVISGDPAAIPGREGGLMKPGALPMAAAAELSAWQVAPARVDNSHGTTPLACAACPAIGLQPICSNSRHTGLTPQPERRIACRQSRLTHQGRSQDARLGQTQRQAKSQPCRPGELRAAPQQATASCLGGHHSAAPTAQLPCFGCGPAKPAGRESARGRQHCCDLLLRIWFCTLVVKLAPGSAQPLLQVISAS